MKERKEQQATDLVKDVLQPLLRQRRALDVLDRAQLAREPLALVVGDRPLLLARELLNHLRVVPQIDLRAHDETWHARTVMVHFRKPLLLDVLERGRGRNAEAHQEDVRLRVG